MGVKVGYTKVRIGEFSFFGYLGTSNISGIIITFFSKKLKFSEDPEVVEYIKKVDIFFFIKNTTHFASWPKKLLFWENLE